MFRRSLFFIAAIAVSTGSAQAQDVPARLFPPAGSVLVVKYAARGVQIYACTLTGSAFQWNFVAPEAILLNEQNQEVGRHYAGPTWEHNDKSKVVGRVLESWPAPRPGAIPWLLLAGTASGDGVFEDVKYIQRLNTVGGLGPAGGCTTPNSERRVDYTADYLYYKTR